MIEAAIMLPIVIALTFGAIEFGFVFNEQGTVRASTRSAARAISTQPKADPIDFYAAGLDSLDASMGNLINGEPQFAIIYQQLDGNAAPTDGCGALANCRVFAWNGTTFDRGGAGLDWEAEQRNACAGETDRVGVVVVVEHTWITGLPFLPGLGDDVELSASTVMALEPFAGDDCGIV